MRARVLSLSLFLSLSKSLLRVYRHSIVDRLALFVPPKSAFTTRYIKLAKGALELLPSVEMTVYRGIKNVSLKKLLNGEDVHGILTWWAFTSTTGTSDVLRDPTFFGIGSGHGDRVVFKIQIKTGVRIKQFSEFGGDENDYLTPFGVEAPVNEDEVMILPGTRFRITAINTYTNNVTEIEMHEIVDESKAVSSQAGVAARGGRARASGNYGFEGGGNGKHQPINQAASVYNGFDIEEEV